MPTNLGALVSLRPACCEQDRLHSTWIPKSGKHICHHLQGWPAMGLCAPRARTWVVAADLVEEGAMELLCRWRYSSLLGREPMELGPMVESCLLYLSLRLRRQKSSSSPASTASPARAPMMMPARQGSLSAPPG